MRAVFFCAVPPGIEALGTQAVNEHCRQMAEIQAWYENRQQMLGEGEQSSEDARFVLTGACETSLIRNMNIREFSTFSRCACAARPVGDKGFCNP